MFVIYISGIDGCGKTTQATMLVEWLQSQGYKAEYQWFRWEPSIVPLIKKIKSLAGKRNISSNKEKTLSSSEDKQHAKWSKVKSKLFSTTLFKKIWLLYSTKDYAHAYTKAAKNWDADIIVMDRYLLDFVIDQSINYGISVQKYQNMCANTSIKKMKQPDLSIMVDIPAEVGFERKMDGTSLKYLKERRDCYLQLPASDQLLRLDGTKSVESIQKSIIQFIKNSKLGHYNE